MEKSKKSSGESLGRKRGQRQLLGALLREPVKKPLSHQTLAMHNIPAASEKLSNLGGLTQANNMDLYNLALSTGILTELTP